MSFENIVVKGENAGTPGFSPSTTKFSTLSKTANIIYAKYELSSAHVFNLDDFQIVGKDLAVPKDYNLLWSKLKAFADDK